MTRKSEIIDRTRERFVNNQGCSFFIVEYKNRHDLWVQFEDEFSAKVHTQYSKCLDGGVRNPYYKSKYGVGYIGLMKDGSRPTKYTREHTLWSNMLKRCYGGKERYKTYANVTVCDRWLCFANFLEDLPLIEGYELWFSNPNSGITLDKDIKQPNIENKIYSLETCMFVTQNDNTKERNERCGIPKKGRKTNIRGLNVYTGEVIVGNLSSISETLNINKSNIIKCCKGKCKTVGGYHWQYVDDNDE